MRASSGQKSAQRLARIVLAGVLTAVFASGASGVGQEFIPLENWSYDAVERFEALGMCVLPEDRPFTREEFIQITNDIAEGAFDRRLSARDRYNFERLEKEYTAFASRRDPQHRYDPPTFYLLDSPLLFEGDVDIIPSFERNSELSREADTGEWFIRSNPDLRVHWGDRVTYNVRYRLTLGPEHGAGARDEKPSRREKSFKGLTSLYERSYVIASWEKAHVFFGREAVDWGPSDWGNLIAPGERHTLDQFGARLRLKFLRLSMFHAQLSPISRRYLAGHRLEMRFGRTVVGVSETAIYAGKQPDPVYFFPLSSFYANQFNERSDDNVLWSVDAKTSLLDRLTVYGSVLLDDFQFERNDGTPDKLAYDLGWRYALDGPLPATLRGRYRFVDIFTYTHRDTATAYVSGEAEPFGGDVVLGGAPGPDTDQWRLEADVFPRRNVVVHLLAMGQRRGMGNDFRRHRVPDDPTPHFPLGITERIRVYGLGLTYEFDRNRFVTGSYRRVAVRNAGNVADVDEDLNGFRVAVHWEFL